MKISAGGMEFTDLDFPDREGLAARVKSGKFISVSFLEIVVGGARSPAVHSDIAAFSSGVAQQLRAKVVVVCRKQAHPLSAGAVNPPEGALVRCLDIKDPENCPMGILTYHCCLDTGQPTMP